MTPLAICAHLRDVRLIAGLSQQVVADQLGVTRQALSAWERGVRTPSVVRLYEWAAAVGAIIQITVRVR